MANTRSAVSRAPTRKPRNGIRGTSLGAWLSMVLVGAGSGCAGPEHPDATGPGPGGTASAATNESARTLANLPTITTRPSVPGYDRSCAAGHGCVFGPAWSDDVTVQYGHNGCSTRDDILRLQLRNVVTKVGTNGCVVLAADLDDPYTGERIHYTKADAAQVAVDHVVALAVSWDLGAAGWSAQQRRDFANDPRNLLATTATANAAKGDRTPSRWRPSTPAGRCLYAQRYIQVSAAYALPITTADRTALLQNLSDCPDNPHPTSSPEPS